MTATTTPSIFRMFYTHRRTQILLEAKGIRVMRIEKVSINKPSGEFYKCVHVIYTTEKGRCSTFISCKEYLARATQKRKQEAENYQAFQNFSDASRWSIYPKGNPAKTEQPRPIEEGTATKTRTVHTTQSAVLCDCEDFENQHAYLQQHPYLWQQVIRGNRICKHSYTVLNQLGFNSLRDYLTAWKPGGRLSNLAVVMNRKGGTYYTSSSMARTA